MAQPKTAQAPGQGIRHLATGLGQGRLGSDHKELVALGGWIENEHASEPGGLFLGGMHSDADGPRHMMVFTLRVAEPLPGVSVVWRHAQRASEPAGAERRSFLL